MQSTLRYAGMNMGDDLDDQPRWPASCPSVLSVTGVDETNSVIDESTITDAIDMVAPGQAFAPTYPAASKDRNRVVRRLLDRRCCCVAVTCIFRCMWGDPTRLHMLVRNLSEYPGWYQV